MPCLDIINCHNSSLLLILYSFQPSKKNKFFKKKFSKNKFFNNKFSNK